MEGVRLPPISGRDLSLLPTEPRPRGGPLQPLGGAGPPGAVQDHEPQQGYGFDPGYPPGGFQGNVCEVNARANKLAKMLERPRIPRLEEERELEEWRRWAQQEETRRQQEVYRAMHRDMVAGRPTLPWEQFEAMVVPERRRQAAARASPKRRPNTDKGLPRAAKPGRRAPAPRRAISSGDPKGGGRRPDPGSPKYGGPPPPAPIYPGSAWGSGHPWDEAPTAPVPLPTKAFFISGVGQPPPPPPPAPPVADLDEGRPRQRPTETAGGGSLGETHPPKRRAAKVRGRSTEAPEQDFMPQEPLLLQSLTSTKATQPLSPPDSPPPLHVPGDRTAGFPWDAPHSSARQPQPWAEDGLDPSLFPAFGPGHFPMPLPSDGTPPFRSDDQQKDAFRDPDFVPPGHLSSMDPPDGELLQVPVSSPRRRSSTRDSLFPLASSVNTVVFPVDMAPDAVTSPHPLPPAIPPRPAALPPPPAASTPTDVAPLAPVRPAASAAAAASASAATASSAATSTGRLPPPRPRKQNSFTKRVPGSPSPMPVQTEKVTSLTSPLLYYEVDVYEDTDVSDLRPQFNLTGSLGPGPFGPPSLRVRTPLSDLPMALRRLVVELHELERERRQELLNAERMEVEIIRRSYRAQVVPRSFNLGLDHDSEAGSPQTLQQRSQPVPASTAVAMDLPPASPLARPAPPPARPQLSEAERERRLLNVQVRLLELQLGERAERDSLLLEERKQWKGTAEHWATELPDIRLAAVRRLEEQESLQREALQRDCGIALHQLGLEQADARGQARQRELDRLLEQELDMMQLQEAVVALGEQEEGGRQRLAQEADGGWAALVDHFQRGWTAVQMADRLRAEQRQRLRRAELAQAEDWADLAEEEAVQWAALMRAAAAARAKLVDNLLRDLRRLEGEGRQAISDTAMAELMALELLGEDAHQGSLAAGQQRALAELEAAERKARWVLEGQCRDGLRGRAVHWATLRLEAGEGAARKQLRAGEDHEWVLLAAHAERARLAASERHLARVTAKAAANRRRVELQEEEGRQRSDAVRQHAQWWTAMEDAFEAARQRCQERVAAEKLVVAHSLGTVLELEEEDRQQLRTEEAGARRALLHEDDRLWVMTAAYALADELAEMEEEEWQGLQHLLRDAPASPIASSASDAGFAPDRPIGHGLTPRAVPSLPASSPAFSHAESPQVSPTASAPSLSASRQWQVGSASACLSPALATARSAPPLPADPSLNPGSPTAFSAATAPLSPSVRSSGPPRPSPTTAPSPPRSPATSAAPAEAEYEGRGHAPGFTEELDAAVQGPARQEAPDSSVALGAEEVAEAERPTSADMVRDFKERYRQKFYRAAAEAAEQLVADQQRLDTAAARERQARVLAMADHDRQQAATMLEANARRRAMLQQEAEEAQAAQAELLARQRSIHEEREARLRELAALEAEQRLLSRVDHLEAPAPVAPALGVVLHAERREEDALEDATSLPGPLQRAGMEARDDRPIPIFIPEAACHHQEPEPPVPPQPTRIPITPQLQVDSTRQDDNDAVQEALAVLSALEGEQRVPVAAAQERSWAQLLTLEAALQNAAMLAAAERVVRARLLEAHRYFCAKHAAGLAETQRRAAVALAEADLRRGLASEEAAAWRAMAEQEEAVRRSAVSWEETKGFLIIGLVGIQTIEIVSRRELQQDYGLSLGVLSRLMQEEVADLWTTQTLRRIQRQLGIVEVVEAQTRIQLATQQTEFWHSCTSAFAQAMHMSVYRRQFSEAQHGIYARVIQRTFGRFRSRRDARGHLARLRLGTIGEEEDEARWDLESEERLGRAEIAGALDGLLERQHRRAMGLPDRPRPCPAAAAAADSDDDAPGNEDADDEDPAALLARQRRQRQKNAPAAPPKERRGKSSKTPRQPLGPLPPTPEAAPRTASPAPDRIRPNLRPLTKQKAAAPSKATVAGVVAVSDTRDLGTVTDYEEFRAVVWEAMRWEEVTAASGIVYYFNAQTQDTHFDPPPGWEVWQRYRIRGDWVVQLSEEAGRCALQLAESTSRSDWPSPPQL